jgi:hypothetical protein
MEIIKFNDFINNNYCKKNKILSSKRIKQLSVFVLANCFYVQTVYAANIDAAGQKVLGVCRNVGYWVCLIMATIEIIKALMQGNTKSITPIITKYAVGYGALFFLPWIFDLIKSIFS